MSLFIAYADITQDYPLHLMGNINLPENFYIKNSRQKHRQVGYFLLWQLLQQSSLPENLLSQIYRIKNGRPCFNVDHIDFNLSHSGNWVAVILSVQKEGVKAWTGIDIEHVTKKRNYIALLDHFGTKDEIFWLKKSINVERDFYQIWCLREAILKVEGVGIRKLNSIKNFPQQCVMMTNYCPQGNAFFYSKLPFYLAFFCQKEEAQISIFQWQQNMLIQQKLKKDFCYNINPTLPTRVD